MNERTRMTAAVSHSYGPPDVVNIEEVDRPVPGAGELLIRVHATTINRTDCGYRGAAPFLIRFFSGLRRPKVTIWGTEFAGEVEHVGSDVTSFQVGERVCGYCEGTFGAHAQFMTIGADRFIARIPSGVPFETAAASSEGSNYALGMLYAAGIGHGDDVLVYGATGAIGSAAVQLAKSLGATVTAVCGTAHCEMVAGLGADRVIDYQTSDFTTDEQRYDLVLDAVGKSTFRACRRLLKQRGIYISSDLGRFVQNPLLALISPMFRRRKVMFPLPRRDPDRTRYLKDQLETGAFKPVIDRTYPLDQIVDAYRFVETGQKIGNVIVTVP